MYVNIPIGYNTFRKFLLVDSEEVQIELMVHGYCKRRSRYQLEIYLDLTDLQSDSVFFHGPRILASGHISRISLVDVRQRLILIGSRYLIVRGPSFDS